MTYMHEKFLIDTLFKCQQCFFATVWKYSLENHLFMHKSLNEVNISVGIKRPLFQHLYECEIKLMEIAKISVK